MADNQYFIKVQPKLDMIRKYKQVGLTDKEIWTLLDIKKSSYYSYKKDYPEFAEAIHDGLDHANARVASQLLDNSLGYEYIEEVQSQKKEVFYEDGKKIKEVTEPVALPLKKYKPSETNAAKFWLTNKDKENWKDKQDINVGGQENNPLKVKLEDVLEELS